MRISDWSSDVCSSDLGRGIDRAEGVVARHCARADQKAAIHEIVLHPIVRQVRKLGSRAPMTRERYHWQPLVAAKRDKLFVQPVRRTPIQSVRGVPRSIEPPRSEEHTSELKSLM